MTLKDEAFDAATRAQDQAAEFARAAERQADQARKTTAAALDSAANTLYTAAEGLPAGERITSIGRSAAATMESAADYLGEHDARDMMSDLTRVVKRHPGRS